MILVVGMACIGQEVLGLVMFVWRREPVGSQHWVEEGDSQMVGLEVHMKVVAVVEVRIVAGEVHRRCTVVGLEVAGCWLAHQQSMDHLASKERHYKQIEGFVGLLVNRTLR